MLNLLFCNALDVMEHAAFSGSHEQDCFAFAPSTTGSANAVHVGLSVKGNVIVDDVCNSLYIQSSCRDIGGDDNIESSILELLDCFKTRFLIDIAV